MPVIISYIPALHEGYMKFFREHPGDIYVLDTSLVRETPRLERDLRALEPNVVVQMLSTLQASTTVRLLQNVKQLPKNVDIFMPDEDVNRNFANNHLADRDVTFISSFLRWDRQITTAEFKIPADRTVSTDELDTQLLAVAQAEADKSADWWRQVGAVVVRDGKMLVASHNRPFLADSYNVNIFGDPRSNFDAGEHIELNTAMHAESSVIAQAAKKGISLEGSSIYVTTFPCPVCAKLVAAAGISKVYYDKGYSLLDAEDILEAANVELILIDKDKPPTR
jgi:dCMP deaminase